MLAAASGRDGGRLQRAAERRDAGARRARGRRDPHLQRDLQADRGHPAGARRHAHRRSRRRRRSARSRFAIPSAPHASARSQAAWSRAASSAAARTSASFATAPSSTTTTVDSLKRFKDDAREVQEGFECGLHLAELRRRQGRRRARGVRDARDRAHLARRARLLSGRRGGRPADPQTRAVLHVGHRAVLAADQRAERRDGRARDVGIGCSTVVSGGSIHDPASIPSKPTIDMSSGHAEPACVASRAARRSPSGRSSRSPRSADPSSRADVRIAARPPSTPNSRVGDQSVRRDARRRRARPPGRSLSRASGGSGRGRRRSRSGGVRARSGAGSRSDRPLVRRHRREVHRASRPRRSRTRGCAPCPSRRA